MTCIRCGLDKRALRARTRDLAAVIVAARDRAQHRHEARDLFDLLQRAVIEHRLDSMPSVVERAMAK